MKLKPEVLIFDINETLLNLSPLKDSINKTLGNNHAAGVWFAELLQYSLVETVTNDYHDFSEIAGEVLRMNALKENLHLSNDEIKKTLEPITKLEAYPDVVPGLKALKKAGYKLIAFSNGKPEVLEKQLAYAKIAELFHDIKSVEEVRKYKPHTDTYHYIARENQLEVDQCMMVAAHGWDIAGALRTGLKTAFVQRPGKFPYELAGSPDLMIDSIEQLASKL